MKNKLARSFLIALTGYLGWLLFSSPPTSLLSVRIGQKFDEVVKASTYPVEKFSRPPREDEHGFGATVVTEPAVIIEFNDPQYGFTLPPTTFAAIAYLDGKVTTIRTSPSLQKLSFSEAVTVLAHLQKQLRQAGWLIENQSTWIDFSPRGVQQLHEQVRNASSGYMRVVSAVAPGKYAQYFGIRRAGDNLIGQERYLVEVSIGTGIVTDTPVTFSPQPL